MTGRVENGPRLPNPEFGYIPLTAFGNRPVSGIAPTKAMSYAHARCGAKQEVAMLYTTHMLRHLRVIIGQNIHRRVRSAR
jgi:hypothetical protein